MHDAELAELLQGTSRTFALAIPLLPPALARQVGIAYLLFRIADTLEDGETWNRAERVKGLETFIDWIGGPRTQVDWGTPTADAKCLELLAASDRVLASLEGEPRTIIVAHVKRTASMMKDFVERQDESGGIELRDLADLKAYCYAVAGIVGEMLTELFLHAQPELAGVAEDLRARSIAFGEGLQLVNIIKDAPADAREGRRYISAGVDADGVARADLREAQAYVDTLARGGAARGVVAFCDLPLKLAVATLDRIAQGAAKLTREEVAQLFFEVSR